MKKILMILLLTLATILPTFAGTNKAMTKCMESWKGYSINDVIDVWGYPTSQKEVAGKQLYYWEDSIPYIYSTTYGVYGGTATCIRIMEVNSDNEVIRWEYKGNACPTSYKKVKKWVNPLNDPWKIEKEQKQQIKQLKKEEKRLLKQQ